MENMHIPVPRLGVVLSMHNCFDAIDWPQICLSSKSIWCLQAAESLRRPLGIKQDPGAWWMTPAKHEEAMLP